MILFAEVNTIELTVQQIGLLLTMSIAIVSGALYIMRLEMKSFVQSAISLSFSELETKTHESKKELNRRIDSVETEARVLRTEVGAMGTAQSYMSSNIDKIELSIEKMESKMDGLHNQGLDHKHMLNQILEKLSNNGNR